MLLRNSIALLVFASLASAQLPLSIGVKAGFVNNSNEILNFKTSIFPVKAGPYLELSLPFLPTIETGIMFEGYKALNTTSAVYQVPVLLKKRFNAIAVKPFLSAGGTIRMIPALNEKSGGLTVAAGLTIGLLPIKIEPEIRFTRWIQSSFTPSSQQTEFLVGIRF